MIDRNAVRAARFTTLLAAVPMMLGMDGGCVYTRQPVEGPQGSFADPYLVGDWFAVDIGDDLSLEPVERAYTIAYADTGELEIRSYMEGDPWLVHRGRSTRIGADKYISLRLYDCPDCADEDLDDFSPEACPYLIYRYQTFLPDDVIAEVEAHWGSRSAAVLRLLNDHRGELLFTRTLRASLFAAAINDGALAGEEFGDGHVCVADRAATLRQFLVDHDPEAFFGWEMLLRRSGNPAISD